MCHTDPRAACLLHGGSPCSLTQQPTLHLGPAETPGSGLLCRGTFPIRGNHSTGQNRPWTQESEQSALLVLSNTLFKTVRVNKSGLRAETHRGSLTDPRAWQIICYSYCHSGLLVYPLAQDGSQDSMQFCKTAVTLGSELM